MRVASLVVFVVIGMLIAWLTRNAGLSAGVGYLIAFLGAIGASYLFERLVLPRRKQAGSGSGKR